MLSQLSQFSRFSQFSQFSHRHPPCARPLSRPRVRRSGAVLLAVAGLVLGACGGDDDGAETAAPESTTTAAPETTTTAAPETTTTVAPAPETTTTATTGPPTTAPAATSPPATQPKPAAAAVTVAQFSFKPSPATVKAGTIVTWTNKDNIEHTVTSGTSDGTTGTPDGKFDGSMPAAGKSFTFTFTTPGSYRYYCSRHASMIGEVVVN